jgi:hypothetical protein
LGDENSQVSGLASAAKVLPYDVMAFGFKTVEYTLRADLSGAIVDYEQLANVGHWQVSQEIRQPLAIIAGRDDDVDAGINRGRR